MSKFFDFFDTFFGHVDDIDMLREDSEGGCVICRFFQGFSTCDGDVSMGSTCGDLRNNDN